MRDFIMVTPARDEANFIQRVIETVASGTALPRIWIIVDDNSRDGTEMIVQETMKRWEFIRLMTLKDDSVRDIEYRYSQVCGLGFEHCIKEAEKLGIRWDYIALLDADTVVAPNYFECLIEYLDENSGVGIVSGDIHILEDGRIHRVSVLRDRPSGTARMWRRECFEDTNGYRVTQAPDSVSTTTAKTSGWGTARLAKCEGYQLRHTSSALGLWKGYVSRGRATYYLGCHPLVAAGRGMSYMMHRRFYLAIPFFIGYSEAFINKMPRIQNGDVRAYYRRTRLREILRRG